MPNPRDDNRIPTLRAVQNTAGTPIGNVTADPLTHALEVIDGTTGSDYGPATAKRDDQRVPSIMAVSTSDGETPISLYIDSSGKLLIQTT